MLAYSREHEYSATLETDCFVVEYTILFSVDVGESAGYSGGLMISPPVDDWAVVESARVDSVHYWDGFGPETLYMRNVSKCQRWADWFAPICEALAIDLGENENRELLGSIPQRDKYDY